MSSIDWHEADRFLVGDSWVGSQVESDLLELWEGFGTRWAGSDAKRRAAGLFATVWKRTGYRSRDSRNFRFRPGIPLTAARLEERLAREMSEVVRTG